MKVDLGPEEWGSVLVAVLASLRVAHEYSVTSHPHPDGAETGDRWKDDALLRGKRLARIARSIARQCGRDIEALLTEAVRSAVHD